MCSLMKVLYILSGCTALAGTSQGAGPRPRTPAASRPGASVSRPWYSRVSVPHSHTLFRPAHHHATYRPVKFQPVNGRAGHAGHLTPWRTSKPSVPLISEYEFMRPASAPAPAIYKIGGKGAIHTIPAPNLSLSEKPIVVEDVPTYASGVTAQAKPNYEVTEKINMDATSARPGGPAADYSRGASLTSSELAELVQRGTLQLVDYVPPAIAIPHSHYTTQYSAQAFDNVVAAPMPMTNDGFLPQVSFFRPDYLPLQNMNGQLYQNYPIEFVPYQPEKKPEPHSDFQIYLLDDEATKQKKIPQVNHKNVIRDTEGNLIVTMVPQVMEVINVTDESLKEKPEPVKTDMVTSETQHPATTVKHIVETEKQVTTPIYHAQADRAVGDILAKGFYSAVNDVRAAAALVQIETAKTENEASNVTTKSPKARYNRNESIAKRERNGTENQKTFIRGAPFSESDKADVAYTFLRAEDKDKVTKDGAVYAGQIVEAAIMEERSGARKENGLAVRPPLRLLMVGDKSNVTTENSKSTAVKSKMPSKNKLINDAKTGEPVLRIFASYIDNPLEKEIVPKISMKQKDAAEKHEILDSGKEGNVKNSSKTHGGSDMNQVSKFGVKLRPKLDDYTSIFEEVEK